MSCANSSCKNCNGTCDTKQTLCIINSQAATAYGGDFAWPVSPAVDETISKVWTAAAWNQLKAAIDAAYKEGGDCTSQGQEFGANPMPTVSKGDLITADIYNKALEAVKNLGGSGNSVTGGGENGTIIRDYHATQLASGYNDGEISEKACYICNVTCDVTCDGCIGCVSCMGVQHYSTCYGSCASSR